MYSSGSGKGQVVGFFGQRDGPSCSIKCGKFLHKLTK
jgi:hypothetical protein